jgi:uncharacterized protein YqeY
MGLKERLRDDLTEAIRSRDAITSGTIRMVLTAITNEEVSGKSARELTEAEVITVLAREAKKRREAAEAFDAGARPEKAVLERAECDVIAKYLPAQLRDEELATMVRQAIAETGASGPSDMGLVMKVLSPKIAGRADGATVSAAVKAALA